MHLPTAISVKWIVVLFLVWVIVTTTAVTILFIHTVPRILPAPTYPALNPGCLGLSANITQVAPGRSGTVRLNCGDGAAFRVGNGTATATPTFTLPTGYTTLRIVDHSVTICGSGGIVLSNGVSIGPFNSVPLLRDAKGLDYCVDYSNAPTTGLDTFTIAWSG